MFKDYSNILGYINQKTFGYLENKIKSYPKNADKYLEIIAQLVRYNTLYSVSRAGTGHLGASLSMIELLTEIYFRSFNFHPNNNKNSRDLFILSKGHGVPSLYSILASKSYFPTEKLDELRRLNGLPGHCDISINGIEANAGSLGMGLSKAVGHAILRKKMKIPGNVLVIAGDGELQEGQCWESLLSASSYKCANLYIIIDINEIQTDKQVSKIVKYNDLTKTFKGLGFDVFEGKGEKINQIKKAFDVLKKNSQKPKIFLCHTKKGQGISFTEKYNPDEYYIWHNKPPSAIELISAVEELDRNIKRLKINDIQLNLKQIKRQEIPKKSINVNKHQSLPVKGFSDALIESAEKNNKIVAFDGDLEEDCGFREFHKKFPANFFEMGIMEQHMVSAASSYSRMGYIPVIATYASFLTSRANEQIYNIVTENNRALIVGIMSGIIPATPGKSHQAFRDIACMSSIPGIKIYQPLNYEDAYQKTKRFFSDENSKFLYLRMSLAGYDNRIPDIKNFSNPQIIKRGEDLLIIGIGPVIIGECQKAVNKLNSKNINAELWHYPSISEFSDEILEKISRKKNLVVVEDHYVNGGFGEKLFSNLFKKGFYVKPIHICLNDLPKCGLRDEVLAVLGLDADSIYRSIMSNL